MSSASPPQLRHLLLPVVFTTPESAAPALRLAREHGARLTLLHVLEPVTEEPEIVANWGDFPQRRRDSALARLEAWREGHGLRPDEAECLLLEGQPWEQIARTAAEKAADLIVMGGGRESGLAGRLLGGTTARVVRHAPCPVLICGGDARPDVEGPRKIMLTTDFSEDSLAAFPWAAALCRLRAARLLLVNVQEPLGLPGTLEYTRFQDDIDSLRKKADARLDQWRQDHLPVDLQVETRVVEGTPEHALARLAEREKPGLMVMSTRGAAGWRRQWLGGTTEAVLRSVGCPVLVVPAPKTSDTTPDEEVTPPRSRAARKEPPGVDLNAPVSSLMRADFPAFSHEASIGEALERIRQVGVGERLVYFYVLGQDGRLMGVLPTRRLLTSPLEDKVSAHMIEKVTVLRPDDRLMEASELFVQRKFLALPVIDENQRLVGVVDVAQLSNRIFDLAEKEEIEDLFETIGFNVAQVREASPVRAFRFRFPWLLATITSGTICAVLTSIFELTLEKSIVLAFFMTLILGLGESVSIQSMTLVIQALRGTRPTLGWYFGALRREALAALLLGSACGLIVALIVWLWRGEGLVAFSIGASIALALLTACVTGLSVPALLHALRLDPKIAAGPITLALTDIFTLTFYFGLAWWLL